METLDVRAWSGDEVDAARITRVAPALVTLALGTLLLFCVGFLQMSAVHNATHDSRHSNGFPCH